MLEIKEFEAEIEHKRLPCLSGRALAAQARGVLGSTPSGCRPIFTFLYFRLITSKFLYMSLVDHKSAQRRRLGAKKPLSIFVAKLYFAKV